jgi:mRNA interferase MazF
MTMRRGDVATVAAFGDDGKPRPAVIVQTDAFPPHHAPVIVCQMTSEIIDAPDFRITIEPSGDNGLRVRSQIMADKPVTVRRDRIGGRIGTRDAPDVARMNTAIGFVMGLAD